MSGQPDRIGRYRLLATLGEGGLGVVYRAQHSETLAQVALKTIRAKKQEVVWRIRREIHALSRIQHPGVIRVVDSGMEDGVPWYAMELLDGMTLESYLASLWRGKKQRSRPLAGTREMGTSALREWVLREGVRLEPTPLNSPFAAPEVDGFRVPAIPLLGAPRPPAAAGEVADLADRDECVQAVLPPGRPRHQKSNRM